MPLRKALGGTAPVLIWRVATSMAASAQRAERPIRTVTGSVQEAFSSSYIRIVQLNVLSFLKRQPAFSAVSNRIQISQSSM